MNNAIDVNKKGKLQGREALKSKGKKHGNVIGTPIISLEDPLENVPPWMHISMGLLNETLEDFDQDFKAEDQKTIISEHAIVHLLDMYKNQYIQQSKIQTY